MRLAPALCWLFLLAAVVGPATAGELSPALALELAENRIMLPLTVLVVMRDGVDVQALDRSLHERECQTGRPATAPSSRACGRPRASPRRIWSRNSAPPKSRGEILEYRAYWIINAVRVTAGEATIRAIAARADVEIVEPDLRVELIEPVARYRRR